MLLWVAVVPLKQGLKLYLLYVAYLYSCRGSPLKQGLNLNGYNSV